MDKGFLYYLGKFLSLLQKKFPKQYYKLQGSGMRSTIFKGIIDNYKSFEKNIVTEVKGKKQGGEEKVIEPTIVKE